MKATDGLASGSTADLWDCVVVGGGAAGLSAALVLGRARRRTLVVDAGEPSNRVAEGMGGVLGHDGEPPEALYRAGRDELAAYSTVELRPGRVIGGSGSDGAFTLELEDGAREIARTVLLATGMDYLPPELPGVTQRWGRSVFHCPFCHGWEVRDQVLGVLDSSARASERALLLRYWSDDITLYTNGPASVDIDRDRLQRAGVAIDEGVVSELRGEGDSLEKIVFTDGREQVCEALLVTARMRQRSPLAAQLGAELADPDSAVNEGLAVDPMSRTSTPGLYAAGDIGTHVPPSVTTSIAAGSTAAKTIVHDLLAQVFPAEPSAATSATA